MKKLYIGSIFILAALSARAQDWKADLLAMNKAYSNASSFRMKVQVQSYGKASDKQPLLDYKGEVASSKGNYYTSIMGHTTISNKECMVSVDKKQKIILYRSNKENTTAPQSGFSLVQIDSAFILMDKNVTVKYLVNTSTEKRLQITYKKAASFSRIELAIKPGSNVLTQIIYYYNTSRPELSNSVEKSVITYTDTEINKTVDSNLFSEKKFIHIKKNKITPVADYAAYKLINQDLPPTP